MKLSKSKLALAKVINENGGWDDECMFASQDKHSHLGDWKVCFYMEKPYFNQGSSMWNNDSPSLCVKSFIDGAIPVSNWHQTCLSREEYYQVYPKADADGWTEWQSQFFGEMPVCENEVVDIRVGDDVHTGFVAKNWKMWGVVTHYCLHKPDVKPEFCESVTRSIPEPESKPTIEQLAQDYRNKLDFANRKQQEADDAKVAADAALGEIGRAGEALNLVISVAKQSADLAINDWCDLKIGDEVEYLDGSVEQKIGMIGVVDKFDRNSCTARFFRIKDGHSFGWPTKWRFIRRP